jgi:hypothetical protein
MNKGTIVQSIIIIFFALIGTYLFVQTAPIYVFACLGLGILIAAIIPAVIFYLGFAGLYNWWYYDSDYDMLG